MKISLRLTIAATAIILGVASAQAADLTNEPAFDWSGFYLGAHAGIGGGEFDSSYRIETEVGMLGGDVSDKAFGAFGGAQIGYNHQFSPNWVLGVEADFSASGIEAEHSERFLEDGYRSTYAVEIDWFGTLRGRIGYAWDNVLLYGTGGAAYGRIAYSDKDNAGFDEEASETNWGWTAGAGVEYGLAGNLTLKTEYLYVDLGSLKATGFLIDTDRIESEAAFHTLKAGLNYKF